MSELFGKLNPIADMASFFLERSKIIQSNIANADTPFYKPRDLVFEKELESQLKLKKTDPRHFDVSQPRKKFKIVEVQNVNGYDMNKVNVNEELAKLAESAIMFKSLNEVLKKEIGKLKLSIQGR
ncbi:flagellar basal body rod protein FlgB [Desulfurobacterium thermolithotrophum]|uniref:flagellar basal body rod protein FlgB n=1 Tax=Desulfurobacterium thermolithotrophum TaxID=64160 RepID=UPI0013CF6D80|nr:flagellar basal body rod protein FlgB [Desulfurobacterium thermolithotrophum]